MPGGDYRAGTRKSKRNAANSPARPREARGVLPALLGHRLVVSGFVVCPHSADPVHHGRKTRLDDAPVGSWSSRR
jgi:hypothetical protein